MPITSGDELPMPGRNPRPAPGASGDELPPRRLAGWKPKLGPGGAGGALVPVPMPGRKPSPRGCGAVPLAPSPSTFVKSGDFPGSSIRRMPGALVAMPAGAAGDGSGGAAVGPRFVMMGCPSLAAGVAGAEGVSGSAIRPSRFLARMASAFESNAPKVSFFAASP